MPLSITSYNREHADRKRSESALAGAAKRSIRQRHRIGVIRALQKRGIDATEDAIGTALALPSHSYCCHKGRLQAIWMKQQKGIPMQR